MTTYKNNNGLRIRIGYGKFLLNSALLLDRLSTVSLNEVSLDDRVESSRVPYQYEQMRSLPDHVAKSVWSSLEQRLKQRNMKLGPVAAFAPNR